MELVEPRTWVLKVNCIRKTMNNCYKKCSKKKENTHKEFETLAFVS